MGDPVTAIRRILYEPCYYACTARTHTHPHCPPTPIGHHAAICSIACALWIGIVVILLYRPLPPPRVPFPRGPNASRCPLSQPPEFNPAYTPQGPNFNPASISELLKGPNSIRLAFLRSPNSIRFPTADGPEVNQFSTAEVSRIQSASPPPRDTSAQMNVQILELSSIC